MKSCGCCSRPCWPGRALATISCSTAGSRNAPRAFCSTGAGALATVGGLIFASGTTPPDAATIAELSGTPDLLPVVEPPPLPWRDWDEVRRVREDLWGYRTLFLHQTENLTSDEQQKLAELLACPVGHDLRVARTFLEAWFAIWQDDVGQRRTPEEAEQRYRAWEADTEASTLAPLRRQQHHLDVDHFVRLSAFLQNPEWESTNNAAERGGRAFRHGQHPHFRLRLVRSIEADLKVRACLKKERFCSPPPTRLHCCQRGRRQAPTRTDTLAS